MEASKFQFSQPRILKLTYKENRDFHKKDGPVKMPVEVEPVIHRDEKAPKAVVELKLKIGEKSEHSPFVISLRMGAKFHWEESGFKEDMIDKLLRQNAVSLLLSYSRPMIATVTSQSRFPTYDLPYIDLTAIE